MDSDFGTAAHKGERVLDLGCGVGIDMRRFVEAGTMVVGVDFATKPLLAARERMSRSDYLKRWDLIRADIRRLPFKTESFDYFYSNGVLHHVKDYTVALREVRRILRPGCQGTILVYHRWSLMTFLMRFVRAFSASRRHRNDQMPMTSDITSKSTTAGLAEVLHHPLIQYFSKTELGMTLRDTGFEPVWIRAHDWLFPISRSDALAGRNHLDATFGRFLVARVEKPTSLVD